MNNTFKNTLMAIALSVGLLSCGQSGEGFNVIKDPVDYVNPYMGNISHLLVPTFPTVHLPNSMLRVYPERADFTGDRLNGLPIIVTNHRERSAFNMSAYQGNEADLLPVIVYSYDQEKIKPYRYQVYLDEANIQVDYAPSHQSAVYSIAFGNTGNGYLVFNSRNGEMKYSEEAVSGYQYIDKKTKVYLYVETDQKPTKAGALSAGAIDASKTSVEGEQAAIALAFAPEVKTIGVRYGVSFIDEEQAKKNLYREIAGYDVDVAAKKARNEWNVALGKISVEGGSESDKAVFYTSLYRCFERPICLSEDGRYYSAFDGQVHDDGGKSFYTDDWIWDTYRAFHPLMNLVHQDIQADVANSILAHYDKSVEKMLPYWAFGSNETWCMIGYHAAAVLADMICKDVKGFDYERAFEAMVTTAMNDNYDCLPEYRELGYVPFDKEAESVSKTLEYAYDDYAIAQAAKKLGKKKEYDYFMKRAMSYRNLYDKQTGYMRGKDSNGEWRTPFAPVAYQGPGSVNGWGDITEGFTVQYHWTVPQDVQGLINLMGRDLFRSRLDSLFLYELPEDIPGAHDIHGRIGAYWHGNEPCHHVAYLYNYIGEGWKCQKWVREIVDRFYGNKPGSLCGNDDCGQMSAWYIFNCLGFYPVCPGSGYYNIGSPALPSVDVRMSNGRHIRMTTQNWSPDAVYINKVYVNGKRYTKSYLTWKDIRDGVDIEFVMSKKPNKKWAVAKEDIAPSISSESK